MELVIQRQEVGLPGDGGAGPEICSPCSGERVGLLVNGTPLSLNSSKDRMECWVCGTFLVPSAPTFNRDLSQRCHRPRFPGWGGDNLTSTDTPTPMVKHHGVFFLFPSFSLMTS